VLLGRLEAAEQVDHAQAQLVGLLELAVVGAGEADGVDEEAGPRLSLLLGPVRCYTAVE
jgi:hypothetical protein